MYTYSQIKWLEIFQMGNGSDCIFKYNNIVTFQLEKMLIYDTVGILYCYLQSIQTYHNISCVSKSFIYDFSFFCFTLFVILFLKIYYTLSQTVFFHVFTWLGPHFIIVVKPKSIITTLPVTVTTHPCTYSLIYPLYVFMCFGHICDIYNLCL